MNNAKRQKYLGGKSPGGKSFKKALWVTKESKVKSPGGKSFKKALREAKESGGKSPWEAKVPGGKSAGRQKCREAKVPGGKKAGTKVPGSKCVRR